MKLYRLLVMLMMLVASLPASSQDRPGYWHDQPRTVHYTPDQQDFVCINGERRFNRALYGGNTGFRVEAGDLPEFAMYLPGMGGNLKFGLLTKEKSKWLIDAKQIESRYRPGSMCYTIRDSLLRKGALTLTVLPLYDQEGLIVKIETRSLDESIKLVTAFGGATASRFSRDGDLGADPESSFYLKPEYCKGNFYKLDQQSFSLFFGSKQSIAENKMNEIRQATNTDLDTLLQQSGLRMISGVFPENASLSVADATSQGSPDQLAWSSDGEAPVVVSTLSLNNDGVYYFLLRYKTDTAITYQQLPALFERAEKQRLDLANRIRVRTPDPYINTLGGALGIAADAIWESPSFMHGAVAWRMRLNGWRGAYAADVLGWHDRARQHFSSYALSQLTEPATGPVVMDTGLHLARGLEKLGTSLFSSGYISRNPNGDLRAHHYDMNLVFIDQLLNHFEWTGDTAYARKMWPLLTRHLAWEKRNFDPDDDGLYDAYAAIWASDALQYSGGGVTHSSAYNYRANKTAANIAHLLHEDGTMYENEAQKIHAAINTKLWLKEQGTYAEYQDLLGEKLLHSSPGLWTIYHAIDSRVPGPFRSYQLLNYIDHHIPHIPVKATGITDSSLYTLSTTNWQPYTWSLNNVALAEVLHTSLAYWQAGRNEDAYTLWKSALIESMYLGASPGNFQQLSFYDAMRGELYRDFADPVGMAARSLVEGLFGIRPDALRDTLYILPGFPAKWEHASIQLPDLDFSYRREQRQDIYEFRSMLPKTMPLSLSLKADKGEISSITSGGKNISWKYDANAIGSPIACISLPAANQYKIIIKWKGRPAGKIKVNNYYVNGDTMIIRSQTNKLTGVVGLEQIGQPISKKGAPLKVIINTSPGNKLIFVGIKNGEAEYWQPVQINVLPEVIFHTRTTGNKTGVYIANKTRLPVKGMVVVNGNTAGNISLPANDSLVFIDLPARFLIPGSNTIEYKWNKRSAKTSLQDWDRAVTSARYEEINIKTAFNDKVTNIFKHSYLSPRPSVSTLQLPVQGIGNWAYPLIEPVIDDAGLRKSAAASGKFILPQGIPFITEPDSLKNNIAFTSRWDNFPDSVTIGATGNARHAYLLMAGSTNAMQSRMINGIVRVTYSDGSADVLELKNPENWWPIEQDIRGDGFAFTTDAALPLRVHLKSGYAVQSFDQYASIKGFTNRSIDGGAATVLDLPLDPSKEIKSITVKSVANDVVIGLMAITLLRP